MEVNKEKFSAIGSVSWEVGTNAIERQTGGRKEGNREGGKRGIKDRYRREGRRRETVCVMEGKRETWKNLRSEAKGDKVKM